MTIVDRRTFLKSMAGVGASAAFPESIRNALAIKPNAQTGTIQDVKHIVVLMQENRSFDHYFGTLRGVRGFQDPRAAKLSNGNSVFQQPNQNAAGVTQNPPTLFPFRPDAPDLGLAFIGDLAHAWRDAHQAWNNGNNDMWTRAKDSKNTMAYLQRSDIPYWYALADAFTICDNYFCSEMTSTDSNRYYMWSGWCGQNGSNDPNSPTTGSTPGNIVLATNPITGNGVPPLGPVVTNAEVRYGWHTYPERLQAAGISWKIYQDSGTGLDAANFWGWTGSQPYIGNYGDNSLLYFAKYQDAIPGGADGLYDRARVGTQIYNPADNTYNNGTLFDQLLADVMADTLPQVSWIVAPEAYTEHPNWPANWGAWYASNVLSALTANPDVFAKTVLIVNYDENDGFFDHIVAPTPPMSAAQGKSTVTTVNEIYPGTTSSRFPAGPYGLGARVPAFVISPWSKGGYVCSEVFDHTSTIRFIEQRFGVKEPNITPWRRAVCGDLTSALDFSNADAKKPNLPSTDSYPPSAADINNETLFPDLLVTLPAENALPPQEPGRRLARALPYELQADGQVVPATGGFAINFSNTGDVGAWFQVRTTNGSVAGGSTGPWGYTVEAGKAIDDTWTPHAGEYDLSVHGPNGFFRKFAGRVGAGAANLVVHTVYDNIAGGVSLRVTNAGSAPTTVTVADGYTGVSRHESVKPGATFATDWGLNPSKRWYDLVVTASTDAGFLRQCAGYVETGEDGIADPALSRSLPKA